MPCNRALNDHQLTQAVARLVLDSSSYYRSLSIVGYRLREQSILCKLAVTQSCDLTH